MGGRFGMRRRGGLRGRGCWGERGGESVWIPGLGLTIWGIDNGICLRQNAVLSMSARHDANLRPPRKRL